ncbi:uncharacterized protein LOC133778429 [Humulus lupulus]|uniref:uncharacterized protein LOC133778429 n=1 Tax=Humulus lupulus TaxID=3486 RepID=UPI002B40D735|nr:uncharacterized protein LOC133778429 [Humulus lupulus]
MGNGRKLKNQWEFKKRENEFDSPCNEYNSSQSQEPTPKKIKLVSSLISHKKDESIRKGRVQQDGGIGLCIGIQPKLEGEKKGHTERSKKDSSLTSNDSGEKSTETTADELFALDDLKLLMESLLEDLKVTRENLFTWMKEEMQKLLAHEEISEEKIGLHNENSFQENIQVCPKKSVKETILVQGENNLKENFHLNHHNKFPGTKLQHQSNLRENILAKDKSYFKPRLRDENSNNRSSERSIESEGESSFDNCYETLEDLDDYAESSRHRISSTDKGRKESLTLHVKSDIQSCHANYSDQITTYENCNGGALESYVEEKKLHDQNSHQALEFQVDYDFEMESITAPPKKKGHFGLLSVESSTTSHLSNQAACSMSSMVPSVQPCLNSHRLEISSCSYVQPIDTGNRNGQSLEGANHEGKASSLLHEERNRSFTRLNTGNVGSFIQGSVSNAIIGTGLTDSQCPGIVTGLSLPRNRFSFENQIREKTNISGLKLDGGALSFSGGRSYPVSEHYAANKFGSHSNNKPESRLHSFSNLRSQ